MRISLNRVIESALVCILAICGLVSSTLAVAEPVSQEALDLLNDLAPGTESNDKDALIALYHASGGESWTRSDGWLSDSPIREWYGVTARLDRVRAIDLSNNNLSGHLPQELSQLTRLHSLDLRWNKLSGPLPQLSELWRLKRLLLTDNQFSGNIPDWIGTIRELVRLDLSHNQFVGSIPSELEMLQNLRSLALHHNDLEGSVPVVLGNLTNLRRLILNENKLSGSIPEELGKLAFLRHLNVSNNRFLGNVPTWISVSESLEWVDLRKNSLESDAEVFWAELPNFYEYWTSPEENQAVESNEKESQRVDPMHSIVMDMWAQTSEDIEAPEVRSFVFELLSLLEVRQGHVSLSGRKVPEFIRNGNIQEVVKTVNSYLKDEGTKISAPNDLEKTFESVEGLTPGRETVDPFATNRPPQPFHVDFEEDGIMVHADGYTVPAIHVLWKKRLEDCRTRYGEEKDCGRRLDIFGHGSSESEGF